MSHKGFSEFEWELKDSRKGDKTLLLGGRSVYSLYDPIEHIENAARRLIAEAKEDGCDHIIIIGLGLGYLPRALYNAGFEKIIVWEPFPVMQESFPVCSGDWRGVVLVVNGHDEFQKAAHHLAAKGSRPKLIIHSGYDIFCRLEHRLAVQTLDEIYNHESPESYIISQRALESLVRLPFLKTVKEFEDSFRGKRAVLVNPGPSLKQCIHVLKDADDVVIFASLQAASYLQRNGVKVNFIVCADPKDMSPFIAECDDDFDAFFAETSVSPATLDWKREKTFLFHFKCGQIHEALWEQAGLPVIDEPVSTVSEVMLLMADYMGFNEIYCVGLDFCWREDRYSYRTKNKCDDDVPRNDSMTSCQLLTAEGEVATTQSHYFHGARFMSYKCAELERKGKRIYQSSGGLGFAPSGVLTPEELERKIHSGNGREGINIINIQSPVTVKQVEHLFYDIKSGNIKSRPTHSEAGKMWPFLQEMPAGEISETCDGLLNKLRGSQIMLHPMHSEDADELLNIGLSQLRSGELHVAEATLRGVIEIKPDEASAHSALGNVLKRLEKYDEAVACHNHAVSLCPSSAELLSNLASAYLAWEKIDMAVDTYRRAIELQPNEPELHFNLGTALQKGEQYEDACISFRQALKINPDHVHATINLGTSLKTLGRLDEAVSCLRRATGLAPDLADAHWNLALTLLLSGDYINGWKEYEWRLKIPDIPVRKFPQPLWDGTEQADKTLLIHAEQGMGDVIQFVRFAEMARNRVGRVILDCHAPLARLLSDVCGVDQVVATGQPLPLFDIHLPLLSLTHVLGATPENMPANVPYLKADIGLKEKWSSKIATDKCRVGLVWAGNPGHEDDHNRSIKLSALTRLLKIPDVDFYSLQKGTADIASINKSNSTNLIDAGSQLTDFADTAALMANLDLIITVDTASAHLAGAMGKPVWILLPFAPDWRWMLGRDNTPWYPGMRIFRQSRPGDWEGVLNDVLRALKKEMAKANSLSL